MKILLFGVTNVGKSTIGKMLSEKIKYSFADLDEETKYGKIDNFQAIYPYDYERHKKRGEILKDIVNKYEDDVVIAVSPIYYSRFFNKIISDEKILSIELIDKAENILKRLVYADENDKIHKFKFTNQEEEFYYLQDIQKDITYYKRIYSKIKNKFDINGKSAKEATDELLK